jgi:hypothetical protein
MVELNKISLRGDGLAYIMKLENMRGINKDKQANKSIKFNNYPI